jgi:hypothetical protein
MLLPGALFRFLNGPGDASRPRGTDTLCRDLVAPRHRTSGDDATSQRAVCGLAIIKDMRGHHRPVMELSEG